MTADIPPSGFEETRDDRADQESRTPLIDAFPGRKVFAWAVYDWANSAYSTLSITVLVSYLTSTLDKIQPELGALVWAWGIGLTMLVAAILSPIFGAIADAHASKRRWLATTSWTGSAACALMIFATPDRPWLLVLLFLTAHLAFELSQGFYNGFLPEIAPVERMERVSAWGYSLGYLGGALPLVIFLGLYTQGHRIGLPTAENDTTALVPRLGLLLMGLWWGIFTIPTILWLKDRGQPKRERQTLYRATRTALREVGGTLRNIRSFRMLTVFLIAFLIYNDGVQTVISQASVFAEKVLEMTSGELAQVILVIQLVAIGGAWSVGRLAEHWGAKPTLSLCLATWTVVLVAAFFVHTTTHFWIMAIVVALVLGGTQSISRAMMGRMTPASHTAEFFGFFNLSGKATSVVGPMFFGSILFATGSAHWAMVSLLAFFLLGWAIVARVDVEQGRAEAARADEAG
jgi:MFS transporter, UMF1 family